MQESVFASLICIIEDRIPFASGLDQVGVLFCLIKEKPFFPCISMRDD